jgi:hypothetical protein
MMNHGPAGHASADWATAHATGGIFSFVRQVARSPMKSWDAPTPLG